MKEKKIDAYIAKSADFAKPVLHHLRELVHESCPKVEESIKWGFPHFNYKGMMCSMAAFSHHCAFGFWKADLMKEAASLGENNLKAMGHSGKIKELSDLPSDRTIRARIKEAMRLNEEGVSLPSRKERTSTPALLVPDVLKKELDINSQSALFFNNLSPSCKREYIEWIDEAKTDATRNKRVSTTIEWLAEGKSRNWKYQKDRK